MPIQPPYYPIVYVRGFSVSAAGDMENTVHDAYYGFAATAVQLRQGPPPDYFVADIFEGQLIRFMKEAHSYVDATNRGLDLAVAAPGLDPSRSIWISRFYDADVYQGHVRNIAQHADDLRRLVCETIPAQLKARGVDLGPEDRDYRVILIAHSMGGLICRTLIQKALPDLGEDPQRWVHRLVTMGTPHGGIELSAVPTTIKNLLGSIFNPFDVNTFNEPFMRTYLGLPPGEDTRSLAGAFPPTRCLCLIGSNYKAYTIVQHATGSFSDGLVKQDRAYIKGAYYANVHKAHSGFEGIVNSQESYENIRRFLFGDTKVDIALANPRVPSAADPNATVFHDIEFRLSIRGSGVYLHRREQDPCENAMRYELGKMPDLVPLHTAFLDRRLRDPGQAYSHFAISLRVVEHRATRGFLGLFDREYPARPIYAETLEIRIGDGSRDAPAPTVEYRWLSETAGWTAVEWVRGAFEIPLRTLTTSDAFRGTLRIVPSAWPQD
jgi:pimeloyl-ACP methyl ester carboxylesterase